MGFNMSSKYKRNLGILYNDPLVDDHQPLLHKFEKTKHCSLKLTNDISKFYFFMPIFI
jgi:hypothetical protein